MIYFDNAATTRRKPPEVAEAVARAIGSFGGVGRGVHEASIDAGMAVYDARDKMARLLGAPSAARVSFAANATMALNVAIAGLLPAGGRAVTTAASHNSVLRPLFKSRDERGCAVGVAPVGPDGALDFAAYGRLLEEGADLVAATHASNLTGDVYDVARMARLAHEAGGPGDELRGVGAQTLRSGCRLAPPAALRLAAVHPRRLLDGRRHRLPDRRRGRRLGLGGPAHLREPLDVGVAQLAPLGPLAPLRLQAPLDDPGDALVVLDRPRGDVAARLRLDDRGLEAGAAHAPE